MLLLFFIHSEAVFTEFPQLDDDITRVLTLKPSSGNASSSALLGALEKAPQVACSSGKTVEVSCQDFSK
jgi:hypothetical protein